MQHARWSLSHSVTHTLRHLSPDRTAAHRTRMIYGPAHALAGGEH